jgi:spore coat polysaccharide biosynthesis protein SpsF
MNVVAVIQARMGSTRLPGKVLADLAGVPMLARVVERVRRARRVDAVWVACSDPPADDPIAALASRLAAPVYRGSETDVLGRFVGAADAAGADIIVRLTADCPLLDGAVIDRVVDELLRHPGTDYASNVAERSYPRGLDVEAFTRAALTRMDQLGRWPEAREHVTVVARLEHRSEFQCRSVRSDTDDSDLRWTVDTADDLAWVSSVYHALALAGRPDSYPELVAWCRANPDRSRQDEGTTWDPNRLKVTTSKGGRR